MNLLAYGLIALAILGSIAGLVGYERKAGADAVRAELQPQIESCKAAVAQQNAAVAALEATSKAKIAAASKGLAKAATATAAARTEAERLRVAAKAGGAPTSCPAGQAVAEIRKGLK